MRALVRRHALFIAFYGTLFMVLTYPFWTFTQGAGPFFSLSNAADQVGVGALFLPKLVFFKSFPAPAARNLMILSHFFLGGLFAYILAGKKGMSRPAATSVALVFTFGSAGAGGSYGVAALCTLTWFPLILLLTGEWIENRRPWAFFAACLVLGQTWLVGEPQTAFLQSFFVLCYGAILIRQSGVTLWAGSCRACELLTMFSLAAVIGSPAIMAAILQAPAAEVVPMAERARALPWSIGALWMYSWNPVFGCNFYIGALPVLLLMILPGVKREKTWWALVFVSFILSLGYWVRLAAPLDGTPFGLFVPAPAKCLFFAAFFLSMQSALAMDRAIQHSAEASRPRRRELAKRAIIAGCGLFIVSFLAVTFLSLPSSTGWAGLRAEEFIKYNANLRGLLFWMHIVVIFAGSILLWACLRRKDSAKIFAFTALLFISMDLFAYAIFSNAVGPRKDPQPQVAALSAAPSILPAYHPAEKRRMAAEASPPVEETGIPGRAVFRLHLAALVVCLGGWLAYLRKDPVWSFGNGCFVLLLTGSFVWIYAVHVVLPAWRYIF